jgi:hypothetical protein
MDIRLAGVRYEQARAEWTAFVEDLSERTGAWGWTVCPARNGY